MGTVVHMEKFIPGQQVEFIQGTLQTDYYNSTLKRTFPKVFLTKFVLITKQPEVKESITKAQFDIQELYNQMKELQGKRIQVRGKVTRFNADIMGKNWLHIRDARSKKDLVVTTQNKVMLGDIVLVSGKVALDKDFGYGYKFGLLIEDAKIEL